MKLFLYRTFTWTTLFLAANTVSFVAGAVVSEKMRETKPKTAESAPQETPVP